MLMMRAWMVMPSRSKSDGAAGAGSEIWLACNKASIPGSKLTNAPNCVTRLIVPSTICPTWYMPST